MVPLEEVSDKDTYLYASDDIENLTTFQWSGYEIDTALDSIISQEDSWK